MTLFDTIQADVLLHPYTTDWDDMGVMRFDTAIGRGNTFEGPESTQFTIGLESMFWLRFQVNDLLAAHTIRRFIDTTIDPKEFKSIVRTRGYGHAGSSQKTRFIENNMFYGVVEVQQKNINLEKIRVYLLKTFKPLVDEVY